MGTLIDDIRRIYKINYICTNCSDMGELSIPKGISVQSYLKTNQSRCKNCGCAMLVRYKGRVEGTTDWKKQFNNDNR